MISLGDITGGDVFIVGKKTFELPLVEGDDCVPALEVVVEGGDDYPLIEVEGKESVGEGRHLFIVNRNPVVLTVSSEKPSVLKEETRSLCLKEPIIEMDVRYPVPVRAYNHNFIDIVLRNVGGGEANVIMEYSFHPNLSPYTPPPRSKRLAKGEWVAFSIPLVGVPLDTRRMNHPPICALWNGYRVCSKPVPTDTTVDPLRKCIGNVCSAVFLGEITYIPEETSSPNLGAYSHLSAAVPLLVVTVLALIALRKTLI